MAGKDDFTVGFVSERIYVPVQVDNSPKSLLYLVKRFLSEKPGTPIVKPPHQRDYVWSKESEYMWIRDILNNDLAPNLFCLYQMKVNDEVLPDTFIMDGVQRLTATSRLYLHPRKYDTDEDGVEEVLDRTLVNYDCRMYHSNEDVVRHFTRLQQGTSCTPYEAYKGELVYMTGYNQYYKKMLDRVETEIGAMLFPLTQQNLSIKEGGKREQHHKNLRDNYALFLRFVLKDGGLNNYYTSLGKIVSEEFEAKTFVEARLREYFLQSKNDYEKDLNDFLKFIKETCGAIKEVWSSWLEKGDQKMNEVLARNLLYMALFARFNDLDMDKVFLPFIEKVLRHSNNGKSRLTRINDQGEEDDYQILQLGGPHLLRGVCKVVNDHSILVDVPRKKRHAGGSDFMHGGHVVPESQGGTKVIPQNAISNRALGANPMGGNNV